MAYRIQLSGRVIEADTATEVQELLVIMATPLPRQLQPGPLVDEVSEALAPARRRSSKVKGGSAKTSRGGGVAKVRAKRAARPSGESNGAVLGAVEQAIREGVSKPAEIVRHVGESTIAVRRALQALVHNGVARAEGATLSRRYYLVGVPAPRARQAAAPAKEAVR